MTKKKTDSVAPRRDKVKKSYYFDADLFDRMQAFCAAQEPAVTISAVIETALRHYLDAREKRK